MAETAGSVVVHHTGRLQEGVADRRADETLAREKGDNGTRELLEHILEGEEESVDWLESQLFLIQDVGLERYLSEMIHE